jgi:hypothetical protein
MVLDIILELLLTLVTNPDKWYIVVPFFIPLFIYLIFLFNYRRKGKFEEWQKMDKISIFFEILKQTIYASCIWIVLSVITSILLFFVMIIYFPAGLGFIGIFFTILGGIFSFIIFLIINLIFLFISKTTFKDSLKMLNNFLLTSLKIISISFGIFYLYLATMIDTFWSSVKIQYLFFGIILLTVNIATYVKIYRILRKIKKNKKR